MFLVEWSYKWYLATAGWSDLPCAMAYGCCAEVSDKEVITASQGYSDGSGGEKAKSGFGSDSTVL